MRVGKKYIKGDFLADEFVQVFNYVVPANDSYTKLLIHGDAIADSTGKTVTAVGTAAVSTAQYKFAELGRSILLDGNSDYLSLADSADWDFGSGEFTIDFWVNFTSTSGKQYFVSQYDTGTGKEVVFWKQTDGTLRFYAFDGAVSVGSFTTTSAPTINTGTWYHIAFVRSGSTAYIFLDGVSLALTVTTAFGTLPDAAVSLLIGFETDATVYLNGYLSQFRVSKGIARWTSTFTPPTWNDYDNGALTNLVISGLDGNTDEEYKLIIRTINGYNGSFLGYLRPNNDSTANKYGLQYINAASTTTSAYRGTDSGIWFGYGYALNDLSMGTCLIYAKSGYVRTFLINETRGISTTTVTEILSSGWSWNDTSNNMTSLVLVASQSNGFGVGSSIELFRKRLKV